MEFRCSECGHIGPAESVRQTDEGVELECAECGATSGLDVDADGTSAEAGAEKRDATAADEQGERVSADDRPTFDADGPSGDATASGSEGESLRLSREEAVERLVPEEGAGIRCPKCAKLLRADAENCVRCGLNLDEARHYDEGEAPWETPEPGEEAAFEQAELLWGSFREDGDADKLEQFVEFVEDENLYEMAIRKVRFYLVDHPDDEAGQEALRKLAVGVQSRIASARAKAEVDAEELNAEIKSFKRKLILSVLGIWAVAIIIFVYIFWW